jgi:protein-tyrosine phosphatase
MSFCYLFVCLFYIIQNRPDLFLGDFAAASRSLDMLRALGITHIVNASNGIARDCFALDGIVYCNVDVDDVDDANIEAYFDSVVLFRKAVAREKGKLLVHCAAG